MTVKMESVSIAQLTDFVRNVLFFAGGSGSSVREIIVAIEHKFILRKVTAQEDNAINRLLHRHEEFVTTGCYHNGSLRYIYLELDTELVSFCFFFANFEGVSWGVYYTLNSQGLDGSQNASILFNGRQSQITMDSVKAMLSSTK